MTASVVRFTLGALLLLALAPSVAVADRPFAKRFGTNDLGNIAIAGNTLMTCPSHCAAENGVGSAAALNNNNYQMVRVDTDGDPATIDSSSATLDVPAGATVLWAGLYWGADTSAAGTGTAADATRKGEVKLAVPGGSGYTTVTSSQTDTVGTRYQGFATVTSLVGAAGGGLYRVADVQEGTGTDRYGGWALVVAYHDDAAPPRNLTVFDGFVTINTVTPTATINVSGFTTAPTGTTKTTLGAISYEGDLGSTGDGMDIDGRPISDGVNPADNIFNSTVAVRGVRVGGGRDPDQVNQLGFDADQFDADGLLGNSATSAALHLTTGGETYFPGALTFAGELLAPKVRTTTVVHDLNGGDVEPGDILEYEITGSNTGNDTADDLSLSTTVDSGLTFVPGSIDIVSGAGAGPQTDAAGDDRAAWDAAGHQVTFRLGTGATPTTGGSLAPGAAFATRFRVQVGAPADGSTIDGPGVTTYTGHGTGDPYAVTGAGGSVTVSGPDLSMDVVRHGALIRGGDAAYELTVGNDGSRPTHGAVTVTDNLPAGLDLDGMPSGTGWDCSATSGTHVSCTRSDTLAPGAAWPPITVGVSVRGNAPGTIADAATVGGGGDGIHANDSDSDSSAVTSQADDASTTPVLVSGPVDLQVGVSHGSGPVVAGTPVTFTATVHNAGPSAATGVLVTLPVPAGLTDVAVAVGGVPGTCTIAGGVATCRLPGLDDEASAVITLTGRVPSDAGGTTYTLWAQASAAQDDPHPADDAGMDAAVATAVADLGVEAIAPAGVVAAGADTSFTLQVHNAGPSDAADVVITQSLPAGAVLVDLDRRCTQNGQVVTCSLGEVPNGDSVPIVFHVHATQAFDGAALGLAAAVHGSTTDSNAANDVLARTGRLICLSRRRFTIHLRLPHQGDLRSVGVRVDGKPVAVRHGRRLTAVVDLRGRVRSGRILVRISAQKRSGRWVVGTRSYKTCDVRIPAKKAPKL